MSTVPIGILGASGQVGRHVTAWLRQESVGLLRLGARRAGPLQALGRPGDELQQVDLDDDAALADFCRGCRVVVNCAGPSYRVLDRVARAAAAQGADYVDVSGDGPAHGLLAARMPEDRGRVILLSAGMLPGLANLVPAWLSNRPGGSLSVHSGGVEALGGAAAADLVLSLQPPDPAMAGLIDYGEAGASWELGTRRSRSLAAQEDVRLDFFPGQVALLPFLSPDAERLALRHRLTTLRWFNVFSGPRLRETLIGLRGRADDLDAAVRAVERAGQLDLLGLRPYYTLVFVLEQPQQPVRRAVITTDSSLALTAATAVSATLALLGGSIPPGLHFADDVLSPESTIAEVQRLHPGTRALRHVLDDAVETEGVL
jgi:hypothetical protein